MPHYFRLPIGPEISDLDVTAHWPNSNAKSNPQPLNHSLLAYPIPHDASSTGHLCAASPVKECFCYYY